MVGFSIDKHPQRQQIFDSILAGRSVREICALVTPPVSFMTIQRYKTKIVKPLIENAENNPKLKKALGSYENLPVPLVSDTQVLQAVRERAEAAPAVTICRARMAKVGQRLDRALDRAEAAVKVIKDTDGKDVVVGQDLAPLAPLINQEHKHIELWGKLTGELQPDNQQQINIQVIQCDSDTRGRD
jgi:hypothetical protein